MSSRQKDKWWEQHGDEHILYGYLQGWSEEKQCIARLKADGNEYTWTIMEFDDGPYSDGAEEIRSYNAEGFEDFDTLEEAKMRVEECVVNHIESLINDLEEILELFE